MRLLIGLALTLALVGTVASVRGNVRVARWEAHRLLNSLRGYA